MAALIFDCDGVLADTERDGHRVAFNLTFAEFGIPLVWDDETYGELVAIGGGKERMLHALGNDRSLTSASTEAELTDLVAELHARKTVLYRELIESGTIPARTGVARLADEALADGWQLAVASTSAAPSVEAVLRSVVSPATFEHFSIFAGDVVKQKKPAPDIYQLALTELGEAQDEAVVVEDSGIGLSAATGAGIRTIVTPSNYTRAEVFESAVLVVDSLGDPAPAPAANVLFDPHGIQRSRYVDLATLQRALNAPQEKQ